MSYKETLIVAVEDDYLKQAGVVPVEWVITGNV